MRDWIFRHCLVKTYGMEFALLSSLSVCDPQVICWYCCLNIHLKTLFAAASPSLIIETQKYNRWTPARKILVLEVKPIISHCSFSHVTERRGLCGPFLGVKVGHTCEDVGGVIVRINNTDIITDKRQRDQLSCISMLKLKRSTTNVDIYL